MAKYRLTPRAEEDLREIWRTIAVESERAADKLLLRMLERLALAASQPQMGVARPELSASARILVEGRYVIIYEPTHDGVVAIAIVHGMRDPEQWLN